MLNETWGYAILNEMWEYAMLNEIWEYAILIIKAKKYFLVEIIGCALFLITRYRTTLWWRVVKWTKHKSTNQALGNWWKLLLSQLLIITIKSKSIYQNLRDKAIFYNSVVNLRN